MNDAFERAVKKFTGRDLRAGEISAKNLDSVFNREDTDKFVASCKDGTAFEAWQDMFGDKWKEMRMRVFEEELTFDADRIMVKQCMYDGVRPRDYMLWYNTHPRKARLDRLFDELTHDLYGRDYDKLIEHERDNKEVNACLIADAKSTGLYGELPHELIEECYYDLGIEKAGWFLL